MPRPPRQSHHSPFLFALGLLLVLVTLAVILEFDGPCKGWFGRLRGRLQPVPAAPAQPAATQPPPAVPAPTPPAPSAATVPPSPEPEAEEPAPPARSELEERYEAIYRRILAELPQPKVGDPCQLTLLQGEQVQGTIAKLEAGRITLRMEYGTMTYPVHVIEPRDTLRLFPTIAARYRALAELRQQDQPPSPALPAPVTAIFLAAPPASATTPTAATTPLPAPPVAPPPPTESRTQVFRYDPTPGPTPEELKPTLAAFGDWLKSQHRRVGGRIADRIFARQQAGRAVLYLQLDPLFLSQDYSIRFQTAEGIQIFWGLRCESSGVARADRAHVVLLDQAGKIVGGSRLEDPAVIWLSEK
ncbi:MAG: hypothetical protein RBU25_02835 [Lentisphaeria bacterium]|jgi:hypothetical protein|nr:hypothetical protein [Lentisphaeria bacterium]